MNNKELYYKHKIKTRLLILKILRVFMTGKKGRPKRGQEKKSIIQKTNLTGDDYTVKTVSFYLRDITEEQDKAFHDLCDVCNQAWNKVGEYAHEHNITNYLPLYKKMYKTVREFGIPSGIAQGIIRAVSGAAAASAEQEYKKQNREYKKALKEIENFKNDLRSLRKDATPPPEPKKPAREVPEMVKKKESVCYSQRSVNYHVKSGVLTLSMTEKGKRFRTVQPLPEWFANAYEVIRATGCVLKYNTRRKEWVVCVSFRCHLKGTITAEQLTNGIVLGGDRGFYNILCLSDGRCWGSTHLRAKARKQDYTRRTCKQKGTRSARRVIKRQQGRWSRFMLDTNRCIAKSVAETEDLSVLVLENLTGVRKTKQETLDKEGKSASKKKNHMLHNQWAFSQLGELLRVKCYDNGVLVVEVDPSFTSQECSCCGHVSSENRHGPHFKCVRCGASLLSDDNAAKIIRKRYFEALEVTATHDEFSGLVGAVVSGSRYKNRAGGK